MYQRSSIEQSEFLEDRLTAIGVLDRALPTAVSSTVLQNLSGSSLSRWAAGH